MDNNSTPEQVWIPFEAQEGRLATVIKLSGLHGLPDFLAWFNRLISDNSIPLGFDHEEELSKQVVRDHDTCRPTTVGDLMDWCTHRSGWFQAQRLVRLTPKALEVRDGKVGLVCDSTGDAHNFFVPDVIRSVAVIPDTAVGEVALNQLKSAKQEIKDNVLFSCNIVAFICDPIF